MFLLKLGSGGVTLWSKRFGDVTGQSAAAATVDPAGHVLLAGALFGAADFGMGVLTSVGSSDVFVAKFSAQGMPIWAKRFGDSGSQGANAVGTDAAGNIVLAGSNTGVVDFGGAPVASAGSTDIFVAKLEAGGGGHIWSKSLGDGATQGIFGAGVDGQGNVLFGGRYAGSPDFGGGPLPGVGNSENLFIAKLTPSGDHAYSRAFQTAFVKHAGAFGVDAKGNALMTGLLFGAADLGFGMVSPKLPIDMYVLKLDPDGTPLWAKVLGAEGDQQGRAVTADPKGHIYVAGANEGVLDFGLGPLTSAGLSDIFLAKLVP